MSLGILDTITRTPAEALQTFRRAYELDPLTPGTGEMLISMATWTGADAEAREVLARLRELNPRNPKIFLFLADYYMEKKDFVEAQKMVDTARGLDPDEPTLAVSQGLLFALSGRRKEAEEQLRVILANENESFRLSGRSSCRPRWATSMRRSRL